MLVTNSPKQNEIVVYVKNKLNKLIEEHEKDVKLNYYLHKEYTDEEYQKIINKINESIMNPPEEKITPDKNSDTYITRELLREAYINDCNHEKKLIEKDMKRANDFKKFLTQKKRELENYPKNTDDLIIQLQEFINKQINYYHKDIVDSYFDLFVNKIIKLCPDDKDYSNTIASVYRNKNSKKAMNIIVKFFETIKTFLLTILMNVKRCESLEYYRMFVLLKNEFKKLIEKLHLIVYNFIEIHISYISDDDEMSNSKVVKTYAETCMSQLNQALISELPELLDKEFKIAITDRMEDLKYIWNKQIGYEFIPNMTNKMMTNDTSIVFVNNKPLICEVIIPEKQVSHSIEDFLAKIPSKQIEINSLVEMYNNYFGTSITNRGISQKKEIKSNFKVIKRTEQRKTVTYYQKLE